MLLVYIIMRVYFSISFLLAVFTFQLCCGEGHAEEDYEVDESMKARWAEEIARIPAGLQVVNSVGKVVNVTAETFCSKPPLDLPLFFLYTRKNLNHSEQLFMGNSSFGSFNSSNPTRFITHGWVNGEESLSVTSIRHAFLQHGDYNVIVIDWKQIAALSYPCAAQKVLGIAKRVAKMIKYLRDHARLDVTRTGLIGHSLGAHVIGLAGYNVLDRVDHAIGLDPALPMFALAGKASRISNESANYVQIIHTNSGFLGYSKAIGKSDFYLNYRGRLQYGCGIEDITGSCSHGRAYLYFAESINHPDGFIGTKAESYTDFSLCPNNGILKSMGGPAPNKSADGKFYLYTNGGSPYSKFSRSAQTPSDSFVADARALANESVVAAPVSIGFKILSQGTRYAKNVATSLCKQKNMMLG